MNFTLTQNSICFFSYVKYYTLNIEPDLENIRHAGLINTKRVNNSTYILSQIMDKGLYTQNETKAQNTFHRG